MSNPYYNYDGAFIPGQLARAESVAAEFQAVQAGFSLLSYYGIDSGTANAYVITTQGAPTGAYSNGQIVQFQALNTGTGSSTINVNSIGAVPLCRFDGTNTQSNDVVAGAFYTVQYDATNLKFRITSPAAYTTSSATVSGAAPTHKVGLTAAGGTSLQVAPIDVTFAIDTAISPTWTGTHTFSTPIAAGSGGTGLGTYAVGDLLYASGTGTLARLADVATGSFLRSGGVGVAPAWGTIAAGDISGLSVTWSGTETFTNAITVNGGGSSLKGTVTIATASSGTSLKVQGVTGNSVFTGLSPFSMTIGPSAGDSTDYFGIDFTDSSAPKARIGSIFAGAGSSLVFGTSNNYSTGITNSALTIGPNGNVTINAPGSGNALTSTGLANSYAALFQGSSTSGQSFGVNIKGGTNSSDFAFFVNNAASSANYFGIRGDGQVSMGPSNNSLIVGPSGNVSITAPSSGEALAIAGAANGFTEHITGSATTGQSFGLIVDAGTNAADVAFEVRNHGGTQYFLVLGNGIVQAVDDGGTVQTVGWRGTPLNSPAGAYTAALSDRGKTISAANGSTITIPANVFSAGDVITVAISGAPASCTIAQGTSLALQWAGNGSSTGNRTLTAAGIATVVFFSATIAMISGAGLS